MSRSMVSSADGPEANQTRSATTRPTDVLDIGRSYLSRRVSAALSIRPPFKPCVRISRTRLTRWSSGRGMHHHPRVTNRAAQATESQSFEEGAAPSLGTTSAESRASPLQQQAAQPFLHVSVELDELARRIARAKVLRPT